MLYRYTLLLKKMRTRLGFSQDFVAKKIGVSRPTYIQIENAKTEMTLSQAEIISDLFGISLQDLMQGKEPLTYRVVLENEKKKDQKKEEIRISVPQRNVKKFKEILLYILSKVGAKPNVGETVLYKLLYFIDFDYYEKFETQLIGAKYIKNHHGPTPVMFQKVVDQMKENNEIEEVKSKYFQYDQKKFLPLRKSNLADFSAQELEIINDVLRRLSDKTAKELSEYSHNDIPWLTAEAGKAIDYEAVFYRTDPYSVRKYEDGV